jgi:YVTN family beta-propeller protein
MSRSAVILLCVVVAVIASVNYARTEQYLWQTNFGGSSVDVIALSNFKIVNHLVVGPQPHGIATPDDFRAVYISLQAIGYERGELLSIDPRTYSIGFRMPICSGPEEIDNTPDGRWLYVPCRNGEYWVVDATSRRVVKKINTGGHPHNTRVSRDGKYAYLSPMGSPKRVTIVDINAGHQVVGEIPFRDSVRPPALTADNKLFFQHVDGLNGFQVADIKSRKVIATVQHSRPLGWFIPVNRLGWVSFDGFRRCHGLEIRPDEKEIWSTCGEWINVHDLTRPGFSEIASIAAVGDVFWLTFSLDGRYAFVALPRRNMVGVVDAQTKAVVRYIEVGARPLRNLVINVRD